jgi:hypothetical protein
MRESLRFDESPAFLHANQIRIGFKTSEQKNPNEHWMNKLSVYATRSRHDVEPGGTICHAEIMMQIHEGEWRRWSIAKKTRVRNQDGDPVWLPGKVHCKTVDMLNDDYVFITVNVPRSNQKRMFHFLQSQVGGGFNTMGYFLNFSCFCCCSIGTSMYSPYLVRSAKKWYCSELIGAALQAGRVKAFTDVSACHLSPNALYRMCSELGGALPGSNPGREIFIDL